jgi:hypothetical protein
MNSWRLLNFNFSPDAWKHHERCSPHSNIRYFDRWVQLYTTSPDSTLILSICLSVYFPLDSILGRQSKNLLNVPTSRTCTYDIHITISNVTSQAKFLKELDSKACSSVLISNAKWHLAAISKGIMLDTLCISMAR